MFENLTLSKTSCIYLVHTQEEWIELESRKIGKFWFNKLTGDTFIPQTEPTQQSRESKVDPPQERMQKSRKKRVCLKSFARVSSV